MKRITQVFIILGSITILTFAASARTDTTFTYQGELKDGAVLANGSYAMDFSLWDSLAGGVQIGVTTVLAAVSVADGRFTVELDYGAAAFDNSNRWLQIDVNATPLSPRQPITRVPYSIQTRGIYVNAAGDVGIGTSGPFYPLHVESNGERSIYGLVTASTGITYGVFGQSDSTSGRGVSGLATAASGSTYAVYGLNHSTSGFGVVGWASTSTGINTGVFGNSNSASGYDFFAGGAGIDYGASSSRRWKNNVVPISDPLYKLAQLRGVYFDWDAEHGGAHDVGMIAEEVGAVLPEIVNYEENGVDANGMDYSKLTPLLVEAVNAQQAQIEDLKTQLASMQSIIKQLLAQQSTDTRRATEDSQGANP